MSKHHFLRRHPGEGTPMILAIVLVLLMLFCTVAEFSRVWIIAQGVKEAAQQAVIFTINDNYDDVYHAVREGYAAGWYPDGTGRWDESVDTGDVYGQLASTLGLENTGSGYQKISNGNVECWPGIKTIASDMRLSRSTVKRALTDLEQHGYLQKIPRYRDNGSSTSNLYSVQ